MPTAYVAGMCVVGCVAVGMLSGVRNILVNGVRAVVERCVRRSLLGAMTDKFDVLGSMRHEWRHVGRTASARRSLANFCQRHPDLRLEPIHDLCDVVNLLEARSGRSVIERAQIVAALLEEAGDPEIHRTLLQTLIPGIVSVCRQLRFGEGINGDPSETVSMALSLASELLVDWAGQSRQYAAPDLLSALRGRVRRWLLKEKVALRSVSNFDRIEPPAIEASPLLTRLNSFRGSQYDRIARITYARVFEGLSLREVAANDHSSPGSLQKELQHFAVRFLI
jgi:hypothetical protein